MSENRDKVYDPDPGKGFTRPNSSVRVVPLTDTLDHLKGYGKITEKISLYVCH